LCGEMNAGLLGIVFAEIAPLSRRISFSEPKLFLESDLLLLLEEALDWFSMLSLFILFCLRISFLGFGVHFEKTWIACRILSLRTYWSFRLSSSSSLEPSSS